MLSRHSQKNLQRKRDFPKPFWLRCQHIWGLLLPEMMSTGKSEYCWMERIKWSCRIASALKISSRTIVFVRTLLSIPMHILQRNADFVGIDNHALWYLSLPMVYCITCSRPLWYFDTILMCSCFKLPVCVLFLNPFLGCRSFPSPNGGDHWISLAIRKLKRNWQY